MRIPSNQIDKWLKAHPAVGEFSARQDDGEPFKVLSRDELQGLVDEGAVCGVLRAGRLRWVELLVPLGKAQEIIGEKKPFHSQANDTVTRQKLPQPGRVVFSHHRLRCFSWRDGAHPVVMARMGRAEL